MDKTTPSHTNDWPAHELSYVDYDPVYERTKTALERWLQGMEQVLRERASRQPR
jgi:hypothetical protein